MTVEYERWLIARGNVFAPSAVAVIKLIERLRKEGWIAEGGHAVRTIDNTFGDDVAKKLAAAREDQPAALTKDWLEDPSREELRLVWSAAKNPLSLAPPGDKSVHTALEIHRAAEYVYPIADAIDPIVTMCKCGEDQEFEWDEEEVVPAFDPATGIFAECEECSRTFDPSKETATIANPFDPSQSEEVPGGAAYRFALVARTTSFVADPKLAFAPELVALVENEFGRSFYEVGATL